MPFSASLFHSKWFLLFQFDTGPCYVVQTSLVVVSLLPQPSKCWDYKHIQLGLSFLNHEDASQFQTSVLCWKYLEVHVVFYPYRPMVILRSGNAWVEIVGPLNFT